MNNSENGAIFEATTKGEIEEYKFEFQWKIESIRDKAMKSNCGESIQTETLTYEDTKWHFVLYPNGVDDEEDEILADNNSGYIALDIVNDSPRGTVFFAVDVCEVEDGLENLLMDDDGYTDRATFPKLIHHRHIRESNKDGILHLVVRIQVKKYHTVMKKIKLSRPVAKETKREVPEEVLDKVKEFLEKKQHPDVEIICQGDSVPCHRLVMAARSDVLAAQLGSDLKEAREGKIDIKDMDVSTVRDMVHYMYTGDTGDMFKYKAKNLLVAANRYQLEELKEICQNFLITKIKTENALGMFVMGHANNAEHLKREAKEAIVNNAREIVQQEGWKEELGGNSDIVFEILEAIANAPSI